MAMRPLPKWEGTINEQIQELDAWGKAVEARSPDFRIALRRLERCDRLRLYSLAADLALTTRFENLSKDQLRAFIGALERARSAVHAICSTQAGQLILGIDSSLEEVDFSNQLALAKGLLDDMHRGGAPLRDTVRAVFVRYVHRCTNSWHDAEVADVVQVAESLYADPLTNPGKRQSLRGAALTPEGDATYTAESQRKWRDRKDGLINRESPWERQWDKRMAFLETAASGVRDLKIRFSR
jgi:hypothetical protein